MDQRAPFLIPASRVAGLIGKHKYEKAGEAFHKYLDFNLDLYVRWELYAADDPPEQKGKEEEEHPISACIEQIRRTDGIDLAQAKESSRNLQKCLGQLDVTTKTLISQNPNAVEHLQAAAQEIRQELVTTYGVHQEAKVVQALKVEGNNQEFYRKDFGSFVLGGRVDGFVDGKLVEIKNRTNRLFGCVPEYERVQVECYMRLLGIDGCALIERLDEEQQSHHLQRNDALWSAIVKGLTAFTQFLRELDAKPVKERTTLLRPLLDAPTPFLRHQEFTKLRRTVTSEEDPFRPLKKAKYEH